MAKRSFHKCKCFRNRLIVALDSGSLKEVEKTLKTLKGLVTYYKIGLELFTAHGWKAVRLVKKYKARVFLDLKLHDIPNTVARTLEGVSRQGVDMVNVHALGGFEMMKKAKEALVKHSKKGKRPLLLGVTVLTSHDGKVLSGELGIRYSVKKEVLRLAQLAKKAGLDGVVSSPQEAKMIRKKLGKNFVIVTPGIRPLASKKDDQKRIYTPQKAIQAGASYLVVGRPILEARDPYREVLRILESIAPPLLR